MKQVRFTSVVEQSGKPEVYLLLVDPKKDADFQRALKERRVMTLAADGGKTNYGTPGYTPGPRSQVLLFPRELKIPDDARVVGINLDLLDQEHDPAPKKSRPEPAEKTEQKKEPAKKPQRKAEPKPEPKIEPKSKREPAPKPVPAPTKPKLVPKPEPKAPAKPAAREKVLPFAKEEQEENEADESEDITEIKAHIRRALKALEAGKQVAAFNILKRIVE